MPIPSLSSKKFAYLLEKQGCHKTRQRGTSHAIFIRNTSERKYAAPIQMAKSSLSPIYIKLVLKQLGFTKEEISKIFG
ncbi:MAG: type II toxin-antitoxin system HicA family toxin [Candidatus Kuenenbacteria bacterium]